MNASRWPRWQNANAHRANVFELAHARDRLPVGEIGDRIVAADREPDFIAAHCRSGNSTNSNATRETASLDRRT